MKRYMRKHVRNYMAVVLTLLMIMMECTSIGAVQVTGEISKSVVYRTVSGRYQTLNPHECNSAHDTSLVDLITEGITGVVYDNTKKTWEFIPIAAEDFPATKDNKVWTMTLRDGLKFSDGSEIDAYVYIESWKRLLDPKLGNRNAKLLLDSIEVKGADEYYRGEAEWADVGLTAQNKKTIVVTLDAPANEIEIYDIFSKTFMSPIKADLYDSFLNSDKTETKYGMVSNQIVGNGAYKIESLIRDKECILVRNENSVTSQYKTLDRLEFTVSNAFDKNMSAFKSGELDSLPVTNSIYRDGIDGATVIKSIGGSVWGISVNHNSKKNIMSSNEFRQALMSAVDRKAIVDKHFKSFSPANYLVSGAYIVGDTIGGKGIPYRETEQGMLVANRGKLYDAELAKELLTEALETGGESKPIVLSMVYPDGQALMRDLAIMIKTEMEKLFGSDILTIKLKPAAETGLVEEWDMRLEPLSGSAANPWAILKRFGHVYNEDISNDIQSAHSMTADERIVLLSKMEKAIMDSTAFIPLFQNDGSFLWSERLILPTGNFMPGFGFGITQASLK